MPNPKQKELLAQYYSRMLEIFRLHGIAALLEWDQQVYMPRGGASHRAEQTELTHRLVHTRFTDPAFSDILSSLNDSIGDLSREDAVNVRETKRIVDRASKLPGEFVSEKSTACVLGYDAWLTARPKSDFAAVKPHLETMFRLCRQEAELVGYESTPYDALLDEFEPGAKIAVVRPLLLDLAEQLSAILPAISAKCPEPKKLSGVFPVADQIKFCSRIASDLGYSFESGRIDATAHPFMTSIGPRDVRITTRFDESDPLYSLYSTIHETGHALYELGLREEYAGTPMGMEASTGIHESQSRTWENLVGRSSQFCVYLHGILTEFFPEAAKDVTPQDIWHSVNHVRPSLIRTEADEVTYSLHVVIRMLLEESLISGDMQVSDIPDAWDSYYERYLGIRPDSLKNGAMQDVHWYSGAVGYFPTYALGNIYGAMFMEAATAAVPTLFDNMAKGDFSAVLGWQRKHVHSLGRSYQAKELVERTTGKPLSSEAFVSYIKRKFDA